MDQTFPLSLVMGLWHPLMTFRVAAVAHSGTVPAPKVAMALARTMEDEAGAGAGGEDEAGEGMEMEVEAEEAAATMYACFLIVSTELTYFLIMFYG